MKKSLKLTIGWLYPDLMSIYGDRGNIIALTKRCEWRGINVEIKRIDQTTNDQRLTACDMLFMGGAQDRQQTIVAKDLEKKKKYLSKMIEGGIPGLYICGGFQFLGHYYKEADGMVIKQLGVLDVYTQNPGGKRLIGNIAFELNPLLRQYTATHDHNRYIILGFENHGGRTIIGKDVVPLGRVIKGYGSNAEDHTEGAIYKNSIGTYLHGPILPKNPILADWLIIKSLEKKYSSTRSARSGQEIKLDPLDDSLANLAHDDILKKM